VGELPQAALDSLSMAPLTFDWAITWTPTLVLGPMSTKSFGIYWITPP